MGNNVVIPVFEDAEALDVAILPKGFAGDNGSLPHSLFAAAAECSARTVRPQ
jgi:hypothetical protein